MTLLRVWLPAAILVLAFPAGAQDRLPACPGQSPSAAWTKCTGTHVFPSGGIYTGEFENGMRHGQGTEFAANGTVLRSGMWENNLFVGR